MSDTLCVSGDEQEAEWPDLPDPDSDEIHWDLWESDVEMARFFPSKLFGDRMEASNERETS